ncbi:hypothetical protein GCM10009616_13930 [Microlunatus lacustris]
MTVLWALDSRAGSVPGGPSLVASAVLSIAVMTSPVLVVASYLAGAGAEVVPLARTVATVGGPAATGNRIPRTHARA